MGEQLNSTRAPAEHVATFPANTMPRSPFDAMLCRLVMRRPVSGRDGKRDGRRAAMRQALDYRANWPAIRAWRRGEIQAPQWAVDLVARKLAERAAIDSSHAELARSA